MSEIKCPHCGEMFTIDESGYTQIVQQVRDSEFRKELERRSRELDERMNDKIKLAGVDKDREIDSLKSKIKDLENEVRESRSSEEIAVLKAVQEKKDEITELSFEKTKMKEMYELQLRAKDATIEQYKDFKVRLSNKMIGESLEQHCSNEFNKIRMTVFPNAYFEKDNDASGGTKGDFIFREYTDDGIELISIMFEMKNEMDETVSKHKNEDFFKKLDKDRKEKNCEYAVLVSMLEMDNELYNNGIVDVSYKYEKMYVIRPQFFIPLITLLRNASLKSLEYKRELANVRSQQVDFSRFEKNLMNFKKGFGENYRLATEHFNKAIKEIDSSIDHMKKIKDWLEKSAMQLGRANKKAEELNVKTLTKDAPTVRAMIEAERHNRPPFAENLLNTYDEPQLDDGSKMFAETTVSTAEGNDVEGNYPEKRNIGDEIHEEHIVSENEAEYNVEHDVSESRKHEEESVDETPASRTVASTKEINDLLWGDDDE